MYHVGQSLVDMADINRTQVRAWSQINSALGSVLFRESLMADR